jgi:molybdopterin molybdotransferase
LGIASAVIALDEALAILSSAARPIGSESVKLDHASGRVLAADVVAALDSPRADVSAMDGYAVREADLATLPARLRVSGESFPGQLPPPIASGECARIFTGAPVPAGADRVVIQEIIRREGEQVIFDADPGPARHIRPRGSDFRSGERLLPAGTLLDARTIIATAAADVASVEVFRRPRVAIIATGDELAEPGIARERPATIPDSVSLGVAALAEQWGGKYVVRSRIGDEKQRLEAAGREALGTADLVIVTGGASVGEKDFAKAMFEAAGLELLFSKVSIKPGKPVWLGRAAGKLVLGLPGNPTSALVTARLFLVPLLCVMTGRDPAFALRWRRACVAQALPACGDRETFFRARWADDLAEPLDDQDSGAQRALALAELLVRRRANAPAAKAGDQVEVLAF